MVGAFAVFGDVQAFFLGFRRSLQADDQLDHVEHDGRGDGRPDDRQADGLGLGDQLSRSARSVARASQVEMSPSLAQVV